MSANDLKDLRDKIDEKLDGNKKNFEKRTTEIIDLLTQLARDYPNSSIFCDCVFNGDFLHQDKSRYSYKFNEYS